MLPPGESRYGDGTDRQDGCKTITLRFLLEASSVINNVCQNISNLQLKLPVSLTSVTSLFTCLFEQRQFPNAEHTKLLDGLRQDVSALIWLSLTP